MQMKFTQELRCPQTFLAWVILVTDNFMHIELYPPRAAAPPSVLSLLAPLHSSIELAEVDWTSQQIIILI